MINENDLVGKGFHRAVGECCVSTEGGWEGFLEEVTFLLAWGREATPSRGNSKCKGREDRSMVSGGGQDSLTSKVRHVLQWSVREPGCLPLNSSCAASQLGDLGQGTSILTAQFPYL